MNLPNRKTARAQWYDYRSYGAYFITICTKHRIHYFGEVNNGTMLLNSVGEYCHEFIAGLSKKRKSCHISEWVIMPNHIHLILLLDIFTEQMNQPYHDDRRDALLGRHNTGRQNDNPQKIDIGEMELKRGMGIGIAVGIEMVERAKSAPQLNYLENNKPENNKPENNKPENNEPENNLYNQYQGPTVGSIINGIKGAVTKFTIQKNIPFAWQSRFYDNIIRDQLSY